MNIIRQSSYTSIRDEPRWMVSKSSEPERQASEGEGPSRAERGIMELWRLPAGARRPPQRGACRTRAGCCMCTGPRRRARASTSTSTSSAVEKLRPAAGPQAAVTCAVSRVRCVAWAQSNDASRPRAAREPGPTPRLTGNTGLTRPPLCSVMLPQCLTHSGARAALSVA